MIRWLRHNFKFSEVIACMNIKKQIGLSVSSIVIVAGLIAFIGGSLQVHTDLSNTKKEEMQMAARLQT